MYPMQNRTPCATPTAAGDRARVGQAAGAAWPRQELEADACRLQVDTWVMSCRAFSRRIEYHTMESLFEYFSARELVLDYRQTERNKVLGRMLEKLPGTPQADGRIVIERDAFREVCPTLPHSRNQIDDE